MPASAILLCLPTRAAPHPTQHTHTNRAIRGRAQVSREPPPPPLLLGGYTVGEQVYYTGASATFENGDRLEHGKQGEMVGPATSESVKGKGVKVRFPGSKRPVNCDLYQVRRRRRRAASHSSTPP